MSEFILAMDSQGSYTVGEHVARRMLAGDIEDVRGRLVYALERLGYQVVSENPLMARRAARKGLVRADFLDYARKLSVSLRPSSAATTVATFDFAVVHNGLMTDGDKKTLELEADAVIALAAAPPAASVCRNCGTENPGDVRFCRLCGAPGTAAEPAELEVARLTAGARASLQEIFIGLLVSVGLLAVTLPMILLGKPKVANAGWFFLALGQAFAWWMILYGVLRLHRTVNPKGERARPSSAAGFAPALRAEHTSETSALPPAPARASVTEGTTELLTPTPARRAPSAVRRERPDTKEVDSRQ
ncbi:MAG TPA: zinc ribbon domain-containing protein [Pyrinomonadaceae bacterium]|nr:zinc ribbon domain-containing protein [Pyrinomonadaceae bacterium]